MTRLGIIFPPDQPPERLREVALAAEEAGLDELWLWEDCFKEGGLTAATAALSWTSTLTVGVGLLPVPLRNVALSAMEIGTLARLFPGRFVPAVGHGVLDWMGQAGARVDSPMTLMREYLPGLRSLLAGERVSSDGRYVSLSDVALDWPPEQVPPVLVGAYRPRTLALAGSVGDGVVVDHPDRLAGAVEQVRAARREAGRDGEPDVVCFQPVRPGQSAEQVADLVRARASEGATRVPVLAMSGEGPPEGGSAILTTLGLLGEARALLA